MNYSVYRFSLDLHSASASVVVKAKRYDTHRKLAITLTDGGVLYHITDDCYAVFTAKKPDGKIVYNECTIEDGVITYAFTPQTTAVAGCVDSEIKLYDAEYNLITSASFTIFVEDAVYDQEKEIESSNEVNALADLISKATSDALAQAKASGEFDGAAGQPGEKGEKGDPGERGVSPTVTLTDINGGVRVAVTDVNGTASTDITTAKIGAAPAVESAEHPGCYYRTVDGVTEWLNPPMIAGVEYRTTERYNGKPVYAFLIDFGYLPNASTKSTLYTNNPTHVGDVIFISGLAGYYPLPYIAPTASECIYVTTIGGMIRVTTGSDRSDLTGLFLVKYTKTTGVIL